METYRPWGPLDWFLEHTSSEKFFFIGVCGAESRSLSVWETLSERKKLKDYYLLQINDIPIDHRWEKEEKKRLKERRRKINASGGDISKIYEYDLFSQDLKSLFNRVDLLCQEEAASLILDISSMPKRFFFPIVKKILRTENIKNLAISYTYPESYGSELYDNLDDNWRALPTFAINTAVENYEDSKYVVGVGFESMALSELLKNSKIKPKSVFPLFPFPTKPRGYRKNWSFIKDLQELQVALAPMCTISPSDVSEIFDKLCSISQNGHFPMVFAPYGPKPMSLAMCLYCCNFMDNSSAFYTQPSIYSPLYSDGSKDTFVYSVKINGTNLYSL